MGKYIVKMACSLDRKELELFIVTLLTVAWWNCVYRIRVVFILLQTKIYIFLLNLQKFLQSHLHVYT